MVHLSCHNCIFLFQSFLVISCEKKKKIYEVSDYTVTQHKPLVRMDTYIDFNDS